MALPAASTPAPCARITTSRRALVIGLALILLTSAPQIVRAGLPLAGSGAGTLSISDEVLTEGDGGSRTVTFTVTHTGLSDRFYVDAHSADGTATLADNDYEEFGGTGAFNGTDGETVTVSIEVTGDTKDETPHEIFYVDLSDVLPFGAPGPLGLPTIAKARGEGKIIDNDGADSTATLSIDDVTRDEGDSGTSDFSFTVTLSGSTDAFTVKAETVASGNAKAGEDFIEASSTLSFAGTAGQTKTFVVKVLGDPDAEVNETFFVRLSDVQGAGNKPLIFFELGRGTIVNDDLQGAGLLITSPASKTEAFEAEGPGGREFKDGGRIVVTGKLASWEAVSTVPWIKITQVRKNPNGGEIRYSVDPVDFDLTADTNAFADRSGGIRIGPETLLVSQQGLGRAATEYGCRARAYFSGLLGASRGLGLLLAFARYPAFFIGDNPECAAIGRIRAQNIALAIFGGKPLAGRSAGGKDLARGFQDFNGDGLEELGVFAPELEGKGRGAWLELYNQKGKKVLSFFADAKFLFVQNVAMDTDGNGKAEAVFLGTEASRASELQLRNGKGKLEDRKSVSPEGSDGTRLMGFELDGARGEEIGITYTSKKGTGEFAAWKRKGKKLVRVAEHSVIPAKSALHQWLRPDVDSDGRDEIAAAYTAPSGTGSSLRVMDPRSGEFLVDKNVLSTKFEQAVWSLGHFDTARSVPDFLVGYRRKGSGKAYFKVLASDGTTLSTSPAISRKPVMAWGTVRTRVNSSGNARDLVFVALAGTGGGATFEVWDPRTKKAKRVASGTLASDEYEVLALQAADFDGDLDNGTEIVAVTRHLANRDIGFQMFSRSGNPLGDRVQVFDSNYVNLNVSALVFAKKGRSDLVLTARKLGEAPEVHVWNVSDAKLLKKFDVLGKDVE